MITATATTRPAKRLGILALGLLLLSTTVLPSAAISAPLPTAEAASSVTALANGVDVRVGAQLMRVTALRDDIIRIRFARDGVLPEDASWAVLADARKSAVPTSSLTTDGLAGFATSRLRVTIDRASFRVVVADKAGKVISADAPEAALGFIGKQFTVRKLMPESERYFGLGDKTGGLDRRDHAFTLWNNDAYGFDTGSDPIYKSIPFVMAGSGATSSYGILMDNTFRSHFDFGKAERDVYSFGAEQGPIDYYILYGPHPKAVLEGYAFLTGTPPLPPRWALGFQQSRYSYMSADRVREIAQGFRSRKIPADAIFMDIDYQDRNRPFTTNPKTFPDLKGLMTDLRTEGFHAVTIVDMHVAAAAHQGYAPYDSGLAGDHLLHNNEGAVYVGKVWPGDAVFPDFTRAKSRAWFGGLYKDFMAAGVSGIWNDMNEPAIFERLDKTMPLTVQSRIDEPGFAPRTATQAEVHNIYGMQNTRATYEGLRALDPNERPYVLTRASYAGGHRYAATWTGDNQSTWEHLKLATPQLLNLGMSGFAYSGVDIGGYSGMPSPDLFTRWIQVHAFAPLMRAHSESGMPDKEVWVHGDFHTAIRKHFIEERYRLMPYLYTLADEAARSGIPMMRAEFLEFPELMGRAFNSPSDKGDNFMLGAALLVATPQMGGSVSEYRYDLELPAGGWYDYWSGLKLDKKTLSLRPTISELPVFVRAGAIIPKQAVIQNTGETPEGPLELHVYPGADCHGTLYLDDGHSYAFQHGDYLRQTFSCAVQSTQITVHFNQREGSFKPWWTKMALIFHDVAPVVGATSDSARTSYDQSRRTYTLTIPDQANAKSIVVPLR